MPQPERRLLAVGLAVACALPLGAVLIADHLFGTQPRVHHLAHLGFELTGTCIALGVAGLLLLRVRYVRQSGHLLWIVFSLVGMGVMDAVHASVPFGFAWSWLRHLATLLGGLLFALAWWEAPSFAKGRERSLAILVAVVTLAVSVVLWRLEALLPAPWSPDGYTWATKAANALGGLGFLSGAVWFARRYRSRQFSDDLAFAAHAALFGSAGLVFGFSTLWTMGWWWLHAVRLVAYAVVLVATYRIVGESFERLGESAEALEQRVTLRTRELEQAQARLRAILANAPLLIGYVGADLRYRFANAAYADWFGVSPEDIPGRTPSEIISQEAYGEREDLLHRALGGERLRFEGQLRHRALGVRDTQTTYVPDRGERGDVVGIYVFVMDVTELKDAQRALAAAKEALANEADLLEQTVAQRTTALRETVAELEGFSYSIAHDMRAPLRAMQGYAQLLGRTQTLDADGRKYVERIQAAAERLDLLIRDVLDYSRVVRSELPLEEIDTDSLVRDILETYPQLQAPGVIVEVVPSLARVRANRAALTQVFSNLLGNAVKFVAHGVAPRVRVRAEAAPDTPRGLVRFWVEDNGIGMTSEESGRIFGMFQRLHAPGAYPGTGMGLAIVKKAVERMGGKVGVESTPGRGSRFWVELPGVDA